MGKIGEYLCRTLESIAGRICHFQGALGERDRAYAESTSLLRQENDAIKGRLERSVADYATLRGLYDELLKIRDPTTIQMLGGQLKSALQEANTYKTRAREMRDALTAERTSHENAIQGLQATIEGNIGHIGHLKDGLSERQAGRVEELLHAVQLYDRIMPTAMLNGNVFAEVGKNAAKELGYEKPEDVKGIKYSRMIILRDKGKVLKPAEVEAFFQSLGRQEGIVTLIRPNGGEVSTYILKVPLFYRVSNQKVYDRTLLVFCARDRIEERKRVFDAFDEAKRFEEQAAKRASRDETAEALKRVRTDMEDVAKGMGIELPKNP